jgi:hypothetical protein
MGGVLGRMLGKMDERIGKEQMEKRNGATNVG